MSTKKASSQSVSASRDVLGNHFSETNLAHAYHIVSDDPGIVGRLRGFLAAMMPRERMHFDALVVESDNYGVEEARGLRARVAQKAFGGRRFIVFRVSAFTEEAQQALLKTIEEPGLGNHFFFITGTDGAETLIPTLRSRLLLIRDRAPEPARGAQAREFLESAPAARLGFVREIIESEDRGRAEEFLRGIEIAIEESVAGGGNLPLGSFYREFIRSQKYLRRPSGSLKMVLEHIALTVPRFPPEYSRAAEKSLSGGLRPW